MSLVNRYRSHAPVPKRVAKQRKDGHVHAEDDDDEMFLIDRMSRRNLSRTASQAQPQSEETPSATLVSSRNAKQKMGSSEDSQTEPESDQEMLPIAAVPKFKPQPDRAPKKHLPSPEPSGDEEEEVDDRVPGRIIGDAKPLVDFRKNIEQGDVVSKAVEDLAWMIKRVVLKPFSSRRQDEMLECMTELRSTCLNVCSSSNGLR